MRFKRIHLKRIITGALLCLALLFPAACAAGELPAEGWEEFIRILDGAGGEAGFSGKLGVTVRSGETVRRQDVFLAGTKDRYAVIIGNPAEGGYDALVRTPEGLYVNVMGIVCDAAGRLKVDGETMEQIPGLLALAGIDTDWLFIPAPLSREEAESLREFAWGIAADLAPVLERIPAETAQGSFRAGVLFSALDPVFASLREICTDKADEWIERGLSCFDGLDLVSLLSPYADEVMDRLAYGEEKRQSFYDRLAAFDAEELLRLAGGPEGIRAWADEALLPKEGAVSFAEYFADDTSGITLSAGKDGELCRISLEIRLSEEICSLIAAAAGEREASLPTVGGADLASYLLRFAGKGGRETVVGLDLELAPGGYEPPVPEASVDFPKAVGTTAGFLKDMGLIGGPANPADSLQEGASAGSFRISSGERVFLVEYDEALFSRNPDISSNFITYLDYTEPWEGFLAVMAVEGGSFEAFLGEDIRSLGEGNIFDLIRKGETKVVPAESGSLFFCTLTCETAGNRSDMLYYGLEADGCLFNGIAQLSSPEQAQFVEELVGRVFLRVTEDTINIDGKEEQQ